MAAKRIKRPCNSVFVYSNLHGCDAKHRKIADTQQQIEKEHKDKPNLHAIELVKTPDWEYDGKCLDLAFVMDCTTSMAPYINTARDNIRKIAEEIVASENCDVRLALVEYRDHPPEEKTFVTRVHDFTESSRTMKLWLTECTARGGGDIPEAVADALHDILALGWRGHATKICVFVSDAPPHGLGVSCFRDGLPVFVAPQPHGPGLLSYDGFPDGCPLGHDPMFITNNLAEKGISLYVVGCEPSILPYKDLFVALAFITGGQYVPLTRASLLTRVIIGGAREEISLQDIMAEVNEDVQNAFAAGRNIDEEGLSKTVHCKLMSQGVQTRQLRRNQVTLDTAHDSPAAKKLIQMKTLAEVREHYQTAPAGQFSSRGRGAGFIGGGGGLFGFAGGGGSALFGTTSATAGFGSGAATFGSAPAVPSVDEYDCVVDDISYAQTSRMVQKSKARNSAKNKCTNKTK